ncbi:MAG: hypothetical protein ACP5D2_02975 [Candidatus Nanoarchaeia archaeon]
MEIKTEKHEKNPLLNREEFVLAIKAEKTPSAQDIKDHLGKPELTVIKKIGNRFGQQAFYADVVIYDNKEAKDKIETIPQKIRKKQAAEAEQAKKQEQEQQEQPEEAPQEAETGEDTGDEQPTSQEKEQTKENKGE